MKIETCTRCGRKLKTAKSIEHGFGPVCYKKHLEKKKAMEKQMTIDEVAG
jgi:hypothetical protein